MCVIMCVHALKRSVCVCVCVCVFRKALAPAFKGFIKRSERLDLRFGLMYWACLSVCGGIWIAKKKEGEKLKGGEGREGETKQTEKEKERERASEKWVCINPDLVLWMKTSVNEYN